MRMNINTLTTRNESQTGRELEVGWGGGTLMGCMAATSVKQTQVLRTQHIYTAIHRQQIPTAASGR
jgi:hypothetical protein